MVSRTGQKVDGSMNSETGQKDKWNYGFRNRSKGFGIMVPETGQKLDGIMVSKTGQKENGPLREKLP